MLSGQGSLHPRSLYGLQTRMLPRAVDPVCRGGSDSEGSSGTSGAGGGGAAGPSARAECMPAPVAARGGAVSLSALGRLARGGTSSRGAGCTAGRMDSVDSASRMRMRRSKMAGTGSPRRATAFMHSRNIVCHCSKMSEPSSLMSSSAGSSVPRSCIRNRSLKVAGHLMRYGPACTPFSMCSACAHRSRPVSPAPKPPGPATRTMTRSMLRVGC